MNSKWSLFIESSTRNKGSHPWKLVRTLKIATEGVQGPLEFSLFQPLAMNIKKGNIIIILIKLPGTWDKQCYILKLTYNKNTPGKTWSNMTTTALYAIVFFNPVFIIPVIVFIPHKQLSVKNIKINIKFKFNHTKDKFYHTMVKN